MHPGNDIIVNKAGSKLARTSNTHLCGAKYLVEAMISSNSCQLQVAPRMIHFCRPYICSVHVPIRFENTVKYVASISCYRSPQNSLKNTSCVGHPDILTAKSRFNKSRFSDPF